MDPINRTCVTCCSDANDVTPCCDCNAKRDACINKPTSDEERSTRKRSSWNSSESSQHSSRATFFVVSAVFVAVIVCVVAWRRCRRRHDSKRRFRFNRDARSRRNRVPKSPQNNLRTFEPVYEKLPMTETNGQSFLDPNDDDDDDVSSDEDFYFRPTLNGESTLRDERRRLVTSSTLNNVVADSSTVEI